MLPRAQFIRLVVGSSEAFERRHGLQRFIAPCQECGQPLATTQPFACGKLRGLIAPRCACGNDVTPYGVVGLFDS